MREPVESVKSRTVAENRYYTLFSDRSLVQKGVAIPTLFSIEEELKIESVQFWGPLVCSAFSQDPVNASGYRSLTKERPFSFFLDA